MEPSDDLHADVEQRSRTPTGKEVSTVSRDDSDRHRVPIDPDLAPTDPAEPSPTHRRGMPGAPRRPGRARPDVVAAIALGGALGAPARYTMSLLIDVRKDAFPWATFWTNITGSFVLGLVLILVIERFPPSRYVRPFVATGFLGAYTTFSTFAVETDVLVKDGHAGTATVYAGSSLIAGIVAVWIGIVAARLIPITHRLRQEHAP